MRSWPALVGAGALALSPLAARAQQASGAPYKIGVTYPLSGPQGAWGVPLDPAAHREKLLDCFSRALPAAKVTELVALFERLETLDTAGVAQLVALIASARPEKK
jgi:hypothetical protein